MNSNDQGSGTRQSDHNADINNEVSPHAPIRSVLPSSSSLTIGRDERPDLNLPFEENSNIVPNNESTNTRVLPSKRRYSNLDSGEFSIGESSRRGTQRVIADQHLDANPISQANSSSCLTNQLANVLQSSDIEVVIGEGSFPNMQNQGQSAPAPQDVILGIPQQLASIGNQGLVPNMPNQIHAPLAPRAPRYIRCTRRSNGYPRGLVAMASSHDQARSLNQSGHYAPVILPVHSGARNEATAPLYSSRNIHGGNRAIAPENLRYGNSRNANGGNSSAAARSGTRAPLRGHGHRRIPIFDSMLFPDNPELTARIMNQFGATQEFMASTGTRPTYADNRNLTNEQVIRTLEIVHIPTNVNSGLTEVDILNRVKRENFEQLGEETPGNKENCVICQEEYVNGEEVGRLDICVHRFHVNCIKQWLLIKNICPLCKQTALAIDVDDHE